MELFADRFGMNLTVFAGYELRNKGSSVWIVRSDPRLPALARLKVRSLGVLLLRQVGRYLKPTSAALQLFGAHAERNFVTLIPRNWKNLWKKVRSKETFPSHPDTSSSASVIFP
jgi:hypothetical protein